MTLLRSLHPMPSLRAALRGTLALGVLAGYLLLLAGSSAGQGWALLLHLLREGHAPTTVVLAASTHASLHGSGAPAGASDALPLAVVTQRGHQHSMHTHGGHAHSEHTHGEHEHGEHTHNHRASTEADRLTPLGLLFERADPTLHEHDGVLHAHAPTEETEPPPAVVSVDRHTLPRPASVPEPVAQRTLAFAQPAGAPWSTPTFVETPPPRQVG